MSVPDRYVVMGNPIAHSKSPVIHTQFALQTHQNLVYSAMLVPLEGFAAAVREFQAAGGKGCNVTVPFKTEAWVLATQRSLRAERAGAVNTLAFRDDGSLFGDNTDGVGLVRDLVSNHGIGLTGRRVLLLGAGGAARGVLEPLLEQCPAALIIANRTVDKALELADQFAPLGPVGGSSFERLQGRFDLIINATSASLSGEVPPLPETILAPETCCYDMMYGAEPTAFMQWAVSRGAQQVFDGLGMLVEQAAEAFALWRGVRPHTMPVIEMLRQALEAGRN